MDFDKLLDARPESPIKLLETTPNALSADEFEKLHLEMESLREKISAGHQCSVSEMRQIVLYFRHRRGKLFTLAKTSKKPAKAPSLDGKPKKAPVRRKTAKNVDLSDLFKTLGL